MVNKNYVHKVNDKKILHKVKKRWVTISLALLMMIGGGAVATHVSANADTTNNTQVVANTKPSIEQQSSQLHENLMSKSISDTKSQVVPDKVNKKAIKYSGHDDTGKITQMTVNYVDKNNLVGTYPYQGPENETPGINTRDDIAEHVPEGYTPNNELSPINDFAHLESDITVDGTNAYVSVNKLLTDKVNFVFNGKIIYTMWNQGGSDSSTSGDSLMDSLHTSAINALKNHQSIKLFISGNVNNVQGTRLSDDDPDANYQANPQDILNSLNQQYGSNPQEYGFKDAIINVPVIKIARTNPQPEPSDNSDASDFYHTITVNYVDKDTNQKVGNSYVDSGENDEGMDFDLINGTMAHVPAGYHYLYLQQPKYNPIPKVQTLTATVEKNQPQGTSAPVVTTSNVDMTPYNNEIASLNNKVTSDANSITALQNEINSLKDEIGNHNVKHTNHSQQYLVGNNLKHSHTIITAKGLWRYKRNHKGKYVKATFVKPHTKLAVKRVLKSGKYTKLQLTNGMIVTGSKKFVTINKQSKVSKYTKAYRKATSVLKHRHKHTKRYTYRTSRNFFKAIEAEKKANRKFTKKRTHRNKRALNSAKFNLNRLIGALSK